MPSGEYHTSSYPDYKDFRDQNHVFSELIGFELSGVDMSLRNDAPPERVWGIIATENYFDVLGVHAAIGRTFHAEPNQALNSDPYIVLSQGSGSGYSARIPRSWAALSTSMGTRSR